MSERNLRSRLGAEDPETHEQAEAPRAGQNPGNFVEGKQIALIDRFDMFSAHCYVFTVHLLGVCVHLVDLVLDLG